MVSGLLIVGTSDQIFAGPPTITNPLIDQVKMFNESVTLYCEASGDGTISYQWQEFNNDVWVDIENSNDPEYTTDRLVESSQFRCVVSNEAGEIVSNDNTTSYTTDTTLAIGQYMYRCRVENDAGSVVSSNTIVNVYGEWSSNSWYE